MKHIFAKKSLKRLLEEMHDDNRLRRVLGPITLTSLGVGAIIGAGIFVATGAAAKSVAGPALMVSYALAGLTCIFAALCYAEFASMAPVAGSAYTYAYTTMGELFAWIIGWDLVLEYAVGSATVANGWSGYFQSVLAKLGIALPEYLQKAHYTYDNGHFLATGSWVNLPAICIVILVTLILIKGIRESATFNAAMVFLKVAAVLFVIFVGAFYINPANYIPFAPFGWTGISFFGVPMFGQTNAGGDPVGMIAGSAIIFFAYIGFDSVSTHAEEAVNPKRDIPIGIIASLVICTVLYIAVVAVLTGMVPYAQLSKDAAVADAFKQAGLPWAEFIIAAAGVAGITSVLLVMMLSGPRVFLAMARDGLIPAKFFADVHPKFRTPWKSTMAIGVFVSVMAGLLPIDALLHLANIGTLFAFAMVCGAVLIMRKLDPHVERPFRCPWVPLIPLLGIGSCLLLMASLPAANWWRLFAWLGIGLVIYFAYSRKHSFLGKELRGEKITDKPVIHVNLKH
ncbi:MAG: amino acid permease [Elusimicrobia bacterium GWF2_52_66]|nr:MAG: amino acid permease [Elusimicrobia bacterium GWA2_51_34]OGR85227.1 MAG: amino acid permease [Elusimicrobia bacterium GWF2_52_66]HAF94733.1 amino acid permease [Elusimicrobiota bacterium]HCE97657.1 amino acid permease [Elusimicrobiota bacterium]